MFGNRNPSALFNIQIENEDLAKGSHQNSVDQHHEDGVNGDEISPKFKDKDDDSLVSEDLPKDVDKIVDDLIADENDGLSDEDEEERDQDDYSEEDDDSGSGDLSDVTEESYLQPIVDFVKENYADRINVSSDIKSLDDFIEMFAVDAENVSEDSDLFKKVKQRIIEDYGLTKSAADAITGNHYGLDQKSLRKYKAIHDLASLDVDMEDKKTISQIFYVYHKENGIPDEEIKSYVATDMASTDLEDRLKIRQTKIKSLADSKIQSLEEGAEDVKEKIREHNTNVRFKTRELLKSRKIGDQTYTKQEIDDFLASKENATEEIVLPTGEKRKVTPFEKKEYEYYSNPENRLAEELNFWLGRKEKVEKKQTEKKKNKTRGSFLDKVNREKREERREINTKKDFGDMGQIKFS